MAKYNVQAKQFGRLIAAGIIEARTRESAISKFKKKHYIGSGYVLYAQKIYGKKSL